MLFLAEAFTRPAMMHELARIGFTQSYTYFTWRDRQGELERVRARSWPAAADYMRPNFFVNTPDILHASLQYGGPPIVQDPGGAGRADGPDVGRLLRLRAVRARRGASRAARSTSNSEKYQLRPRDWARPERTLAPYLTLLNQIRRAHPALQRLRNLAFHHVDSPDVLCCSKRLRRADGTDDVVLVVRQPRPARRPRGDRPRSTCPRSACDWDEPLHRARRDHRRRVRPGPASNYVRLDPFPEPAHVLTLQGESAA